MNKRLLKCVRENWLMTILTPIMMLGEVAMTVLIPYKMADMIDYGIEVGNMAYVKQVGMELLLYAVIGMLFGIIGGITASSASAGFARNIRQDMFEKIQTFSFSNIDKFSTAGLVTRMTTDVSRVQMSFMMSTRMAFRAPSMLIFSLIMAFSVNRKISLVFLASIPILVAGLLMIMKFAMPLFETMFGKFDDMNKTIQENVRGIRVVKSFVREDFEKKKFLNAAGIVKDLSVKAEKVVAVNAPLMNACVYGTMIAVSWIGAKLVVSSNNGAIPGGLSTGQLTSMFSYIMQILTSLMMLSIIFVMITMSQASAKRIAEVLDEVPDIKNCDDPNMAVDDGSIEFKNVYFAYPDGSRCVRDANIKIKSGETIGIIGGTGSGKSSFVQLIPRLYDASSGEVFVGGANVKNIDLTTLRKSVAMVLQKNVLFEGTIRENLLWGNENAGEEEMWHALRLAQADGFVKEMEGGLDAGLEQGGANLSGGQRQRMCIARALMASPKILILDDSTSAVDTATEKCIREGFRELMPDTTKLIIAQRISSVQDADRIIVFDDGEISGIGTHDELLRSNEIYREVYESQTKGGDFDEPTAD